MDHHQSFTRMIEMSSSVVAERSPASPMPILHANGLTLSAAPRRLGYLTPTSASTGLEALRRQYQEQGYLFLKGFLDRQEVMDFRGWVFERLAEGRLTEPGTDFAAGISASRSPDKAWLDRRLMSLVRSTAYEGFCAQPRLAHFMDAFLGGLSYLHKRKIMRFTQPGTETVTPAHYDLVYLRGGTSRIVTAWIPIGDTSIEMGGLTYLEGSHTIGSDMEAKFQIEGQELTPEERISAYNKNMTEGGWVSKDLPEMAERFDTRWLVADYEAGDIMLHSPFMIHASTTNRDPERRIRLSTDIRYQNVDDEIDARWNNHWSLNDML